MTATILIFAAIILVSLGVGIAYFARQIATKRATQRGAGAPPDPATKNPATVTLDRNPEMPKMPGATS